MSAFPFMPSIKRTVWSIGILLLILIVTLGALIGLAPRLVNLEKVRNGIQAFVTEKLGATLSYSDIKISYLPYPSASLRDGKLSIPHKLDAEWKTLRIRPELLTLLTGSIRIADVILDSPQIAVRYELESNAPSPDREDRTTSQPIGERSSELLSALTPLLQTDKITIHHGSLVLIKPTGERLSVQELEAKSRSVNDKLRVNLAAKASQWKNMSLEASWQPQERQGNVQLSLNNWDPSETARFFQPNSALRLGRSDVNVSLEFTTSGPSQWQLDVSGSLPALSLLQDSKVIELKGKTFQGSFSRSKNQWSATLDSMLLTQPSLRLSGFLTRREKSPQIKMQLEGEELDVAGVRKTALDLFGSHEATQKIFDVVRGGIVPAITFTTHGETAHDLGRSQNIEIEGKLSSGAIYVPKVDLDLRQVSGNVIIGNGILKGSELQARLGDSTGTQGTLELDLLRHHGPFHLNILVDGNLAQLPPILARLVHNRPFAREMRAIKEIEGRALGWLTLGDTRSHINAAVQATNIRAKAVYPRIPYPVQIMKGEFTYEGHEVTVNKMDGTIGKSRITSLSGAVDWSAPRQLRIDADRGQVDMNQVFPWLQSYSSVRKALRRFKNMQGKVTLDSVHVKGPLLKPRKWDFHLSGSTTGFHLNSDLFPGVIKATEGSFEADPEKLGLSKIKATLVNTSLQVSGNLLGYLSELESVDLILQGNAHEKVSKWAADLFALPPQLRVRAPYHVSKTHLKWNRKGKVSAVSNLAFPDGPRVQLTLSKSPSRLDLQRLVVNYNKDRASFLMNIKDDICRLSFDGAVGSAALDRVFQSNDFLHNGRLTGKMEAEFPVDRIYDFNAVGNLKGSGLKQPWPLIWQKQWPFELENIALRATGKRIVIDSADIRLNQRKASIKGALNVSQNEFGFDLNVDTAELNWAEVRTLFKQQPTDRGKIRPNDAPPITPPSPVAKGVVRVKAARFGYGDYVWEPFNANVMVNRGKVEVAIGGSKCCGISTPGTLRYTPAGLRVELQAIAKNQPLDPALDCLWHKQGLMKGMYNLKANLKPSGQPEQFFSSLAGDLDFSAGKGRIHRFTLLSKIFAMLNVTEIFRGKLPDLAEEGFAYNSIVMKGPIKNGKLTIEEGLIDGASMDIAWQGECDLGRQTLNLTVLVAPLKTVDSIIKYIPLVNKVLNRGIISIPVKVTGPIADPHVLPLAPEAVGAGIFGIIERVSKLPLQIIQPLLDGGHSEGKKIDRSNRQPTESPK